ncbi:unnamed protein product [Kluyveromyces dobzhanskii CBS 2104]|uniref:WGS project CCBQ000000000 data, contig 00107 n=1 Tax=Kluyveromyces dobzhanskii CBS 2104 TaxID=1427455 RepID=A0A0A8L131_9SACH|nr:unnamed protein product [Kluyveromyces dobzhanskii CBS 2104]
MSVQKQELQIFSDHTVLSKHLFEGASSNLMMVTDTAATNASWLVNALVETVTLGGPVSLNGNNSSSAEVFSVPVKVVVGSFLNSKSHFTSSFDRLKIPRNEYSVLEIAEDLVLKNVGKPVDVVIATILKQFQTALGERSLLVLEKPELLMALFKLSSDDLHLKLINPLLKLCSLLIVVTSVESFDNDFPENLGKNTVEFVRFTTSCFHKSFLVLSVRPLDTGKAKDVTGTLALTRGGALLDVSAVQPVENHYLFHNFKENTSLFYR